MDPSTLIKPDVSEKLAIDLSFKLYGLEVLTINRMISYDDQNFHITVSKKHENPYISNVSESGYTLKITNTAKSALEGHFDSMHSAMVHLHNKGLRVPLPVRNLDGNTWNLQQVPLQNKESADKVDSLEKKLCGVHLLTYIPGNPVSTVNYTAEILYQWGVLLAQFHNAVEDFANPVIRKKSIFWDLEHVPSIRDFMEGLEENKKNIILSVLEQHSEKLSNNIDNVRKGYIHGDFNENNILVQPVKRASSCEVTYTVKGILDFEDMQYGTYIWDVGVMLAYSLLDCKAMDPIVGAGHALAGYLSLRSLQPLELSLLKVCIASRLSQSLVLGAYSYRLDPSNTYLTLSSKTGWNRLEQIWKTDDESLLLKWKEIQTLYNK